MSLIYFHHYYARKGSHFREIIRRNTDLPKVRSIYWRGSSLLLKIHILQKLYQLGREFAIENFDRKSKDKT